MGLRKSDIQFIVVGAVLLAPIYVSLLGTQVFILQTLLVCCLLPYVLLKAKGVASLGSRMTTLDILFYLYFAWVLFSFLVNLIFSFDTFEIQIRRVISAGIAVLLMSSFFVGRAIGGGGNKGDAIVKGVFLTYFFVLAYVIVVFSVSPSKDLYMIRRIIGQRLPMVIAFVATLACAYYLAGRRKKYSGIVAGSGLTLVLLSLTRAAYIQVLVSLSLLVARHVRFSFVRLLMATVVVILIAVPAYYVFRDAKATRQIVMRFEQTFDVKQQSTEDPSGSFRIAMWKFLGNKLLSEPHHLIVGYGQLGPSFITDDLVLPDGTTGAGESAHSQYIDILVREGLIGLMIFLALCYKVITLGRSKRLSLNNPSSTFVFANTVAMAGIMFYSIFHETVRYPMFGFYFWLYLGMLSRISQNTSGNVVEKVNSGT
jgi:O-antigen ligase